jgi:phosphatidylglycerol:prolipoprotein diacylglycerol transferase
MHPYLFDIPLPFGDEPFHLRSFGVLVAVAFLFGAHVLQRFVARHGDDPKGDPERFSSIIMWVLFGIFGGARLMYVAVEILRDSPTGQGYLEQPLSVLYFWEGGLVMYGGMAGGILLGIHRMRKLGVRWVHALDMGIIAAFFAQAIGRVGCLMVGDDFGKVVAKEYEHLPFPITVHVPDPLPGGSLFGADNAGQVLWATQSWMSLNALLLGFVAWWIFRHQRYAGQTTLWTVVLYSIGRYTIENFRGDKIRGVWFDGAMSTSQLISVLAGLAAVALLFKNRGRRDETRPAAEIAG